MMHLSPRALAARLKSCTACCLVVCGVLAAGTRASAYSVLTHEAIIDSSWDDTIRPALDARFPRLTVAALREARAYAYGGCIIQDMGYYPFGSKLFTDLAHYVRTGDFVKALLADARTADEYAFALGALAHYAADTEGHEFGINRAEPLIYPQLRQKFGARVTYAQDPAAHLKTEFAFDVVQVARNLYPTSAFHDFIGFQVARPLLERAFLETYGLALSDLFLSEDLTVGTFRFAVSKLIPEATKVAWQNKQQDITRARPGITRVAFVYNLSKADYAREWGNKYERPGFFARLLALVFKVIPKVGPFRPLQFRVPPADADADFMRSFNATVTVFRGLVGDLRADRLALVNRNFDTGRPTAAGEYILADRTYGKLMDRLAKKNFDGVGAPLRRNLLAFYADTNGPNTTKNCPKEWKKTMKALEKLEGGRDRRP